LSKEHYQQITRTDRPTPEQPAVQAAVQATGQATVQAS